MTLHDTPLRIAEDDNGNGAVLQVLLRHHVLVRGNRDLESGFLGGFQQRTVDQPVPTRLPCFGDGVTCEKV